ncbi:hypothetical protein G6F52_014158 [Rhizopus delemar]|nr:hypothetical protein G6F52_014158 [Rhizopus delemar]
MASKRRAYTSIISPSSVATTSLPARSRSKSVLPTVCSSLRTCWLTVDCVRCTRLAARVKLPSSATHTRVLRSSRSNMMVRHPSTGSS